MNLKLTIEYDGTAYHGWQKQKNARTVQETIESAVSIMVKAPVRLIGSGRTDAGVHALAQVANFHCEAEIPPKAFVAGLNSLLPDDIVIRSCEAVDERFHSQYNAKLKTYRYRILNAPLPPAICRQYVWFIPATLDISAMQEAAKHLIGTHDFTSFEASGSPRSHSTRTVHDARIFTQPEAIICFEITANGFLRFMVRNIIGTLVDVGIGKISPEGFRQIRLSRNRDFAGKTAPARGLFLVQVIYDEAVVGPLSR
ncbi:MAG: tRNA pseudouridine(38-40) synthase TruA [Desulfobacterales bacterium]|nr:tRNA pseudouridine(38-40) synthase TruA [Desulfobacterales bacterium]